MKLLLLNNPSKGLKIKRLCWPVLAIFLLSISVSFSQTTLTWPAINLATPSPVSQIVPLPTGGTVTLALTKTTTVASASVTSAGGPIIWNMDVQSSNINASSTLTLTFSEPVCGLSFCLTGLSCGSFYADKLTITGTDTLAVAVLPTIGQSAVVDSSLIIASNVVTTPCPIGTGEGTNPRLAAIPDAVVTFAGCVSKVTIKYSNSDGSVGQNPPAQSIGLCNLTYNTPLPLKLNSFASKSVDKKVQLLWNTSDEVNFAQFEVQKGQAPQSLETMATVKSAISETKNQKNYVFYDTQPSPGINYYRLKMVDLDGSAEYSKILSQNYSEETSDMLFFPNPISVADGLSMSNMENVEKIKFYSVSGQQVYPVVNQSKIHFKNPGQYIIQLTTKKGHTQHQKIFVSQ